MSVNQSSVSATSSRASTSEPFAYQDGASLEKSVHDGYNSKSLTPVGEISPPARVFAVFDVGSVIGFAPAWRATVFTCVSGGWIDVGVRYRKLLKRKRKQSVSICKML